MESLKILDFAVIIRNKVDIGRPKAWSEQTRDKTLQELKSIIPQENELAVALEKVFTAVCSLSKNDMIRFELPEIELFGDRMYHKTDQEAQDIIAREKPIKVQVFPAIHRSGVLIANFHIRFQNSQGFSTEDAIEYTRTNLKSVAIKIPEKFVSHIDIREKFSAIEEKEKEELRFIKKDGGLYLIGSLKDYTSFILRPIIRKLLKNLEMENVFLSRCISSTLTQIYKTSPECDNIDAFTSIDQYGVNILGIATMNKNYKQLSTQVAKGFSESLSSDQEFAVYTFGLSDLLICNSSMKEVTSSIQKQKHFKQEYTAVMYNTMHYGILLEWIYLEKFIIDHYNRLLSHSISSEKTSPEEMLSLQKQSMHDLMVYKVGITPYPSREEFLEKARIAHRIPELQEKLEKKRDLAMDYVLQEYTLRTNKSIQLVNLFVSATAAFGLMEVILSISDQETGRAFWAGLTVILFISVVIFLSISSKFIASRKNRSISVYV